MAKMNLAVQAIFKQKFPPAVLATDGDPDIYITSGYGWRTMGGVTTFHNGTDYGTNVKNLPMYSLPEPGEVHGTGFESGGAGYWVRIWYSGSRVYVAYFHMQKAASVSKGQKIAGGTLLGYTGTTGNSSGIHLHLEIRLADYNTRVDPEPWGKAYNMAPIPTGDVGTPVARNDTVNQAEVLISGIRGRKRPELTEAVILGFVRTGIYDLLEERDMSHEASNGYFWLRVEDELWVVRGDKGTTEATSTWTKIMQAVPKPPPESEVNDWQAAKDLLVQLNAIVDRNLPPPR